jgi:hypothetical protein
MGKNISPFCIKCVLGGQWNSTFLAFSLIIEGATEKVLQFIMPLKSIHNKNLGFVEQKNVFLNTAERF